MDVRETHNTPKKTRNLRREIPAEMIEEILLNLPVKSVLRFTSVSKPWNSIVTQAGFVKRYRDRAVLPSRERLFLATKFSDYEYVDDPLSFTRGRVSNLFSVNAFTGPDPLMGMHIWASCDELVCAVKEDKKCLFLWNPSMETYRELPPSQFGIDKSNNLCFGLTYDSLNDDYKLVKGSPGMSDYMPFELVDGQRELVKCSSQGMSEMYSLRSDSWKTIPPFPVIADCIDKYTCSFVSGSFHWLCCREWRGAPGPRFDYAIISFNLSTEQNGEVMLPHDHQFEIDDETGLSGDILAMDVALMGKLCLGVRCEDGLCLWAMEDYGVVESWNEMFRINCNSDVILRAEAISHYWRPFYVFDSGDGENIVFTCASENFNGTNVVQYVYAVDFDNSPLVVFKKAYPTVYYEGKVFVHSLVSPATWPTAVAEEMERNAKDAEGRRANPINPV